MQEQLTTRSMRWLRRRNGVQRAEELWSSAPQRRASDGAGASGEATTADHFRQTLELHTPTERLVVELRAATSLARLWCGQKRCTEALALLQPVYDRFTKGFDPVDLKAAKALVDIRRFTRPEPINCAGGVKRSSNKKPLYVCSWVIGSRRDGRPNRSPVG